MRAAVRPFSTVTLLDGVPLPFSASDQGETQNHTGHHPMPERPSLVPHGLSPGQPPPQGRRCRGLGMGCGLNTAQQEPSTNLPNGWPHTFHPHLNISTLARPSPPALLQSPHDPRQALSPVTWRTTSPGPSHLIGSRLHSVIWDTLRTRRTRLRVLVVGGTVVGHYG